MLNAQQVNFIEKFTILTPNPTNCFVWYLEFLLLQFNDLHL